MPNNLQSHSAEIGFGLRNPNFTAHDESRNDRDAIYLFLDIKDYKER